MKLHMSLAIFVFSVSTTSLAEAKVTAGIQNNKPDKLYGSPIQLESCRITPSISPTGGAIASSGIGYLGGQVGGWGGAAIALGGAAAVSTVAENPKLLVRFVNEGSKTAELIRIRLGGAGPDIYIRETHLLEPGDDVTYKYNEGRAFGAGYTERAIPCDVDFIKFTDNSTWSDERYKK